MLSFRSLLLLLVTLLVVGLSTTAAESISTSEDTPAPDTPAPAAAGGGLFGLAKKLISVGINGQSTDLEAQRKQDSEDGIERLTDENIKDVFESGTDDDVWVIAVHGLASDIPSANFVEIHKNASILANNNTKPLDTNFRFARLNYQDEWKICSKWLLFKPPWLVIASKKGEELRFLRPAQVRADAELLWAVLENGRWTTAEVWQSKWSEGGSREWLVDLYINLTAKLYKYTANIPKWPLMILISMAGQYLLTWLHKPSGNNPPAGTPGAPAAAATPEERAAVLRDAVKKSGSSKAEGEGKKEK
nr:uncharacterized protein CI109_004752 [Kwoniella shandongensis]KAA5526975.1 hypothetical protein CI109_004752 [Kwoniella shandongensis]